MNNNKKTAFGIVGAAAATLITVGLSAPAMASTPGHDDSSTSSSSTRSTSSTDSTTSSSYEQMIERVTEILNGNTSNAPIVISPQLGVGDVASGNALGSGNTTSVGNGTSVLNGSGNGNSASNSQGNGNTSSVTNSTGDIGDQVNTTVDGILGDLGLSSH